MLSYRFVNVNAVERQGKRLKWERKPRWLVRLLETMEGALHAQWWQHIVAAVVLLGELNGEAGCHTSSRRRSILSVTRRLQKCQAVLTVAVVVYLETKRRKTSIKTPKRARNMREATTKVG